MKKYKHLYFDLDRTIWDLETNSYETLEDLFNKYELDRYFENADVFIKIYRGHNEKLWKLYREGKIQKVDLRNQRFNLALNDVGVDNPELAKKIGDDYINLSPTKKALFPYAHETLDYLSQKYDLHIITNGFKEVQHTKLENTNLAQYFKKIVTSDDAGAQKPRPEIFHYALTSVNAKKEESIMIGDDMKTDIAGAKNFGIDQVFFNSIHAEHEEQVTFEISSLEELKEIL